MGCTFVYTKQGEHPMFRLLAVLTLGVMVTVCSTALAAPALSTLSWTAPDTRQNGDVLEPTEIKEFRIYQGLDITEPLVISEDYTAVTGENAAEITVELTPRVEPYVMSFAITTVDTFDLESDLSNTVTKTFEVEPSSKPGAPTSIRFSVACEEGSGCNITEITGVSGE